MHTVSQNGSFTVKMTPMQLYPKMLKRVVYDKQLGGKFRMAGREDVNSYMEKTDKMINHTRY